MEIKWYIAEVVDYEYTYQYSSDIKNQIFALKVQINDSKTISGDIYLAKPANMNIKHVPLIGELVLIYKTFNVNAKYHQPIDHWYYVSLVAIQSSVVDNRIPGVISGLNADSRDSQLPGKSFKTKDKLISPLQLFEGDIMLEGRSGNSIRFSSTIDVSKLPKKYYLNQPTWTGDVDSDPIIILANGRKNIKDNEFVIENLEQDNSSLYLTSTQKLTKLKINNTLKLGTPSEKEYSKSQLIGIADRIVLSAKKDVVVIDAKTGIELLSENVNVGIGDMEAMVQSTALETILNKILMILSSGHVDGAGSISVPIAAPLIAECHAAMAKLKSKTIKLSKFK